jgi:hypothetical protein
MKRRIRAAAPLASPAALSLAAPLAVLLSLVLASCLRGSWAISPRAEVHELRVLLPEAPPAWASLTGLRMSLSWRDPEGRGRNASAEPGSRPRIEVGRGFPQALIALPSASGRLLLPAGALYPQALTAAGGEELLLDWRGGYAASLASALEEGGIDPAGFDLYALVDKALARSSDPWLLQPLEAARRLAEGSFRIDAFKEPERFPLALPGSGPWAPESPFAPAPEGAALAVSLPEGLWRFVGEGKELFVSVDEKGVAAFAQR